MRIIGGATLLDCEVHADARGELTAFEPSDDNLPFPLRRVFLIKVDSPDIARGGHANSCDEFIVALNGAVSVELDNGREQASVRLHPDSRALWVKPGVLINLCAFDPGTLLLVCASASYAETRHFDAPQPHLMMSEPMASDSFA